jgi:serine/threonine protein kinase
MMIYPLIGDYDLAVSRLDKFVKASQFSGGIPVLNRQNQIFGYSGGYSVVYPINVNGKKMALRCWIKDPGNVKERYARVKSYLISNPAPYFVDFGYIDAGIIANGNTYPVSYMDWIEGKTFSQFIDENINNSTVISELADKFLAMVKELHRKQIAHGDLQDGNIIVCKNAHTFNLKLVDYDSLYTPTLQNWQNQDDLMGVLDYQHPKRYKKGNEKADYFSELVIYLSLLAYAERPGLWNKGQEKRLLFVADDFRDPPNSATFRLLKTFSPRVKNLADILEKFCYETNTNRLSPLEQVSEDSLDSFFKSTVPSASFPPQTQPSVTSNPPGVPSSDFSKYFSSSHVQQAPSPKIYNSSAPQPSSSTTSKYSNWQNLISWFSISSHLKKNPLGFWKTTLISTSISGLVTWLLRSSEPLAEFIIITSLFSVTPLAYLITKNKIGILLSLWGISIFQYFLSSYWDWTGVVLLSVMAIAGALGFTGISSPDISFMRIFVATSLSATAFTISIMVVNGSMLTDFSFLPMYLGSIFSATVVSILITKILGRG